MQLLLTLFLLFISTSLSISLVPLLPLFQPPQNQTLLPNPLNATLSTAHWPPSPYHHPINKFTSIWIHAYLTTDIKISVSSDQIEAHLLDISDSIRRKFVDSEFLPVNFRFTSADDGEGLFVSLSFFAEDWWTARAQQAQLVAQALVDLTARYGARGIEWADLIAHGRVVGHFAFKFESTKAAARRLGQHE